MKDTTKFKVYGDSREHLISAKELKDYVGGDSPAENVLKSYGVTQYSLNGVTVAPRTSVNIIIDLIGSRLSNFPLLNIEGLSDNRLTYRVGYFEDDKVILYVQNLRDDEVDLSLATAHIMVVGV